MKLNLILFAPSLLFAALGSPMNGDGLTQETAYEITTVEQLQDIREDLDAFYRLANDIDASATTNWNVGNHDEDDGTTPDEAMGFEPIGRSDSPFTGSLNGAGFTITNLYINRPTTNHVGVFGSMSVGGYVYSLGVVNNHIIGAENVGGVVGVNWSATVKNCYSTGTVTGLKNVGGVVGNNYYKSTVSNCYATGGVTGNENIGGVAGYNYSNSLVSNSYAMGTVSGTQNVGGLVGYNTIAIINNSYATGEVTGNENVGGVVGDNNLNAYLENCFWNSQTCDPTESGISGIGIDRSYQIAEGKTTVEMQKLSTFTDTNTVGLVKAWDFAGNPYDDEETLDYWVIVEDDYPKLAWAVRELRYTADVGGSVDDTLQYVVAGNDGTPVTAIPDDGYNFIKWSDESTESTRTDLAVTEDRFYTAYFEWNAVITNRDSLKQLTVTGIPIVDTSYNGEVGKEDTLITTTIIDTLIDSLWEITDTLKEGGVTASSVALFISFNKTEQTPKITTVTNTYDHGTAILNGWAYTEWVQRITITPNPSIISERNVRILVGGTNGSSVRIAIYDNLGNIIDEQSEEIIVTGNHCFIWDMTNLYGIPVASGSYVAVAVVTKPDGLTQLYKAMIGVKK